MKEPKEILRDAGMLIKKYGWIQGSWGNHVKGYCMLGSIAKVTDFDIESESYDAVLLALAGVVKSSSLILYNDTTGRTKEEVIEVMLKAANS